MIKKILDALTVFFMLFAGLGAGAMSYVLLKVGEFGINQVIGIAWGCGSIVFLYCFYRELDTFLKSFRKS